MSDNFKGLFGAWDQAIGTIISAISSTPTFHFTETAEDSLELIGNVMQATGNALIADSEGLLPEHQVGNEIQAIGNITILTGFLLPVHEKTEIALEMRGHFLQALGGCLTLPLGTDDTFDTLYFYNLSGAILQIIGNVLQGFSAIRRLHDMSDHELLFVGGWLQATGATLHAILQSKA